MQLALWPCSGSILDVSLPSYYGLLPMKSSAAWLVGVPRSGVLSLPGASSMSVVFFE